MTYAASFPMLYTDWYAARLFMDAGVPAADVLACAGVTQAVWDGCQERYSQLHFADTGWVAHAFERGGLAAPQGDRALYKHLTGKRAPLRFGMRDRLAAVRRVVEADPRIGPFADVYWIAQYLCERHFPTIRYVHNGTHVCVAGQPLQTKKGDVIEGIDCAAFRKLGERWFTDGKRVYGQGEQPTSRHWFVARGADPATFRVLNQRYAADKEAGYYITNLRLTGGDPGSFAVVSYPYGNPVTQHAEHSHYAKDSHRVYSYGVAIDGADAASFEAIGVEGKYFADKHRIYWERTPIEGADRESFTCAIEVGQYRAFDKNRVYYGGKVVSSADDHDRWAAYFAARPDVKTAWFHNQPGQTERVPIGGPYFSDGQRLWVEGRKRGQREWVSVDYIDHNSFRHVVDVFAIDRSGLRYVEPRLEGYERPVVKGADPESFEALGDGWYRCANQAYFMNLTDPRDYHRLVIVKADMASFRLLGGAYAMDAEGLIVEGVRKRDVADPEAVKPIGRLFATMGEALLFRGKEFKRIGALDLETARSPAPRLLIDSAGHMLLGSRYRKPVAGMNAPALRFLNPYFAVDGGQLYALTDDGLMLCEGADVEKVTVTGSHSVGDGKQRFALEGNRLAQMSC
ncbi:DKNYY domain-containing protein [Loktanella sp. F6476L]|uniref:DKNYY domain-containing protein n=1 Tax=Loktanella sp. F6476L TaxID=2926405 RepID=UPI001FF357C8|nr:DKNYY domain-containing protein [Loktanella sp. F6476L]MCK0122430.1 DKNYY domain-containing protein [Loktanella sp. F6476L]